MEKHFTGQDVQDAYERIKDYVRLTPLEESIALGEDGRRYFFKLESEQLGKSFKIRGALNAMAQLTDAERERGVGTVSTGNHGVAVSCAAKLMGIDDCVVVVPMGTPPSKTDRIRFYGARSMTMGSNYDEALTLGINFIDCAEVVYIDPFEHDPRVYCGQGTIGIEIMQQMPDIDTIVVPVGGGGLITGIAVAAKSINPNVRIVGVQTEACPAMVESLKHGICYTSYPTHGDTVCGAVVGGIGELAFEMLPDYLDELVVVSEKSIRSAFRFLIKREQCIIEAGSAMVVAAVREYPDVVGGNNVALVCSGGNGDIDVMTAILNEDVEDDD